MTSSPGLGRLPEVAVSLLPFAGVQDLWGLVLRLMTAGFDRIHVDSGCFGGRRDSAPPSVSPAVRTEFGPHLVYKLKIHALKNKLRVPIDIHWLSSDPVTPLLRSYIDSGADSLSLHWTACRQKMSLVPLFCYLKAFRVAPGLAISPDDDIDEVGHFLKFSSRDVVDFVSLSGTTPGAGGQPFDKRILGHPERLRMKYDYRGSIHVDGGIEPFVTAPLARAAGADLLVVGTSICSYALPASGFDVLKAMSQELRGTRSLAS